jgi:hypothetical protein
MNFKWHIDAVNYRESNGLMIEAIWRVVGTEGTDEVSGHGSVFLEGKPDEPGFIPYEDLTEQIVLGWVKEDLGAEKVSEIEGGLVARLQKAKDPVTPGVPWAPPVIIPAEDLE